MDTKQSIRTAEGMALVRAIEAQKLEGIRVCYDPIACSLVNGMSLTFSKLVIAYIFLNDIEETFPYCIWMFSKSRMSSRTIGSSASAVLRQIADGSALLVE